MCKGLQFWCFNPDHEHPEAKSQEYVQQNCQGCDKLKMLKPKEVKKEKRLIRIGYYSQKRKNERRKNADAIEAQLVAGHNGHKNGNGSLNKRKRALGRRPVKVNFRSLSLRL